MMGFKVEHQYSQFARRKRIAEENKEAFFIPGSTPGTVDLKSPYDWKLANYLKTLGGPTWVPSRRVWHMSEEMITPVTTMMESIHIAVKPYRELGRMFSVPENDDRWDMLRDEQREGVQRILRRKVQLLRYDMGVGKTPTAITAMRLASAKSILIVCPASVKKSWEEELSQWWKEVEDIFTVWTGKDELRSANVTICNYELLKVVANGKYDFIVVDEAQNINNGDTIRAAALGAIGRNNNRAFRVALSGTPVTSEPTQWHGIMSWLLPGCWGSWYGFAKRYFYYVEQPYFEVMGLREDMIDEFNFRLTHWVHDVNKDDIIDFKLQTNIFVEWETSHNAIYRPVDMTHEEFNKYAETASTTKVAMSLEWARKRRGKRLAILTHLRDTASKIADAMEADGFNVYRVDGSIPPARRWKVLSEAREQEDAVLVTTMHAIKTGINILTVFEENVAYAELYWAQEPVSQSIARFNRWTSKKHADVTFLCLKGTVDEAICRVLVRRIGEANALAGVSREEKKIVKALESKPNDKDVANLVLAELAMLVTDEYGVVV
jgi:SNF2 family DNA or RNA helicase